jgi:hypothetical protein
LIHGRGFIFNDEPRTVVANGEHVAPFSYLIDHDDLYALAAEQIARKHAEEYEVLATLGAGPELVSVFESVGGSIELFEQDDARLIFVCIMYGRDHGQGVADVAVLAKRLLIFSGLWDAGMSSSTRGPRWSDQSLAALFEAYFPLAAAVRLETRRLIDLHQRIRDAADHFRQVRRLLSTQGICTGAPA